jgi:hypothetical protein
MVVVTAEPLQVFAVGVTEYVTVPVLDVAFSKVFVMVEPELLVFPEIPAEALDVQAKVVPATLEVKLIFTAAPEQMVEDGETVGVTVGIGFTVMV